MVSNTTLDNICKSFLESYNTYDYHDDLKASSHIVEFNNASIFLVLNDIKNINPTYFTERELLKSLSYYIHNDLDPIFKKHLDYCTFISKLNVHYNLRFSFNIAIRYIKPFRYRNKYKILEIVSAISVDLYKCDIYMICNSTANVKYKDIKDIEYPNRCFIDSTKDVEYLLDFLSKEPLK